MRQNCGEVYLTLPYLRTRESGTRQPHALKENLKPAQAEFLQGKMKLVSEGYEYAEFAKKKM